MQKTWGSVGVWEKSVRECVGMWVRAAWLAHHLVPPAGIFTLSAPNDLDSVMVLAAKEHRMSIVGPHQRWLRPKRRTLNHLRL
jgi:hypothetical protein